MIEDKRIPRERMVAEQLEPRGIRDPLVLEAMRTVPRERFVDDAISGKAYSDGPLPIGEQQTISQPYIVARMSELCEPKGGGRVLEIGTGSGYQAAVLAHLFEQVYTVERIRELSRRARGVIRDLGIMNVHFKIFDGTYGWSEFCPYDAILVTAASPQIPQPLVEQLKIGGHMVLPLAEDPEPKEPVQTLVRLTRREHGVERSDHGRCRFVPLIGRFGWQA